jgi:uncharacterized protein
MVINSAMWIAELWRYPVKSMAGERLPMADIRETGIVGDRVGQVINAAGRTVTSRTMPGLLGYYATLNCYVVKPGMLTLGDAVELGP